MIITDDRYLQADVIVDARNHQQVTLRRARLILGWVTVCGQVHHLGM